MRRIPPLAAVRAFEAAARLGNFTRAGEELGMTQAAVSYRVKLLEERLGVPLFNRVRRQVMLTEAGQTCLPGVRDGFDRMTEAMGRLARLDDAGVLTVSVAPSFASKWLVPRLDSFQAAHPEIDVHIAASMQAAHPSGSVPVDAPSAMA